jgi:hypothetical protein
LSVNSAGAAPDRTTELVQSFPGGPTLNLRLFPRDVSEGPALDRTAATSEFHPPGLVPADSLDSPGPAVATTVPIDFFMSSPDGSTAPGSVANIAPAMSPSDLARAWEAAGDWLADLTRIEAAEATELAARLAPVVLAAGVFLSWGSIYHSTRRVARNDPSFALR